MTYDESIASIKRMPDEEVLARTLWAEARGESYDGKVAVAHVILNRVKHPSWGDTIKEVVLQRKQFSCFNSNDKNLPKLISANDEQYYICLDIAEKVIRGEIKDPTHGSCYYINPKLCNPSWTKKLKKQTSIGNHTFYKDV